MKKKLNIPSTQLIQDSELTNIEKEKEYLNGYLIDSKGKLLKFTGKKQWEMDMSLVVESEKTLKYKYDDLEKNCKRKKKSLKVESFLLLLNLVNNPLFKLCHRLV